ncbi:MAG: hypothetical protein KGJ86_11075 [Chloroflexota bacterium]|nr:hypothetical protein [Chloroflexota bacterium]
MPGGLAGTTAAIVFAVSVVLFALLLRQFGQVPNRWAVLLAVPIAALEAFWCVQF